MDQTPTYPAPTKGFTPFSQNNSAIPVFTPSNGIGNCDGNH